MQEGSNTQQICREFEYGVSFHMKPWKPDDFPLWGGSATLAAYFLASPPLCAVLLSSKPGRVERAERREASQSLPVSSPALYLPTQVFGGEVCWWGEEGRGGTLGGVFLL